MPLLRKKVFEKHVVPDYLRDEEEVFYCEITNEIFRDYHDFSERMFLCNSMVWTCSMTGKSNLTYQEAMESEENAIQCLKEFSNELKLPILYLSTLTKRTSFGDMAEDVFAYTKDRYFVGENVEACFTANKWKDCHIISVIAPDKDQYHHELTTNGSKSPSERNFVPSALLYKYEIEHLDADDNDISEIMIVDSTQLRRKKIHYSKDKCKLFLKQNVEQDKRGIFIIKPEILEKFNVKNVMWETLFDGPQPNFQSSKNFEKALISKKKHKQETMSKYLEKNGFVMKKEGTVNKEKKNSLIERMKERDEEFKRQKQLNEERKALIKQKKKEENLKLAQYVKDWSKPKEDLELEDHMKLPLPTPVKSKVPDRHFGDMLSVLEFVHCFPKILSTKDFFPGGFTLEVMQRALTEKEVAGPLTDLIQMLLVAIFNCQEDESNSYNTGTETLKDIHEENLSRTPNFREGTHLATLASKWPIKYQGLPISRLPLYSLTVSEVLRLHLLASGARIKDTGARWRYAQRGGFTSEDDPGLFLRLHQAHILKALAIHNVVQLSISDKLKIIFCLINQILTYADVRDIVEENLEKMRQKRLDLRSIRSENRKRELEFIAQKSKLKKEMAGDAEGLKAALEKLETVSEKKQIESQRKIEKLMKSINEGQVFLGRDRAYRKYLKIDSIPGFFVNWEDELAGSCLEKVTVQYPDAVQAGRGELMSHIKNIYEPKTDSSPTKKENSPSLSPKKVNGVRKSSSETDTCLELLLCTTDRSNCPVHSDASNRPRWSFFHEKQQISDLIKALNKRGIREGELKEALKCEEEVLATVIAKTPVNILNPEVEITEDKEERPVRVNGSNKKKDRYEDANLGYPPEMDSEQVLESVLVENILEMEEKISGGALGSLKMKDREMWRNCIQNRNYEDFEKLEVITNDKEKNYLKVKKSEKDGSRSSTPDIQDKKEEKEYQDPGRFLGSTLDIETDNFESKSSNDVILLQADTTKTAIKCLAIALCQVAEAVDEKYLKRPLGHADLRPSNKHKEKYDVLEWWEQSLRASSSFSQVFLHYGTLDSCVMWSRSALLARCQICRRQKDSENMLLCDSCNMGHHMYCLKPKLTSVPKGDWFCDKCKKEKEKQEKLLSPEPVRKRRRIFIEEEADEEEEQDSGNEEGAEEDESNDEEAGYFDYESELKVELCKTCGSGGETVACDKCEFQFHKECIEPPLRRLPRSPWTCPSCLSKSRHHKTRERIKENGYNSDSHAGNLTGFTYYSQRQCAAKASLKIHAFAKALRDTSSRWIESNDDDDSDNEVLNRRGPRREEKRNDLPLHNAALQELLTEIMKNEAAWPFLRPVQQKEVPDYYEIIAEPMDFGTIKYKLNMGEYTTDAQLMKDVVLIFENCNTYNASTDEVYKCGEKLLSYFCKRAKEMGLTIPSELEDENDEDDVDLESNAKRQRTK